MERVATLTDCTLTTLRHVREHLGPESIFRRALDTQIKDLERQVAKIDLHCRKIREKAHG